jgi:poly [ADP-ribose] polymerase
MQIEVRPTYLIMVTTANNNKFYNCFPEGNTFRVEYGRVDSTVTTVRYPISEWNKRISAKINKGYKDITDLKTDLVSEKISKNPGENYKTIENEVIRKIVDTLQSLAKETVKKNYTIAASAVTQAMVDKAQEVINELANIDKNVNTFNENLLRLFEAIPRRMSHVNNYLAKTNDEFAQIIQREQDLLDVLAGQVYVKPDIVEEENVEEKEQTILEELGLEFEEVDDNDIKLIKALMNESKDKFRNAWKVKNLKTQERFDKFIADNDIKNTKLLFHGSRSENFWSIIKTGLMIRPSNAVYTGSMFADGLYFAPKCQKSIGYTSLAGSYWAGGSASKGYMAIFEVAYGTPHIIYQHDSSCYRYNYDVLQSKNPKCHCLHASASKGMLRNDEIVFYRTDQVTIKYLIEIGN